MKKKRVFISFDYDHDADIKGSLVAQSKLDDSPFEIIDMSIKKAIDVKWRDNARKRIKSCDYVVFLCGEYTDSGVGVSAELSITQEEKITYFLLRGRRRRNVKKPKGAKSEDQEYNWTRNNLKLLLEGKRGSFLLKE